jgi:hypothetical protein
MRCEDDEGDTGGDMGKEEFEFWSAARVRDHQDNVVLVIVSKLCINDETFLTGAFDIPA